jgi:hypothetical protein
VKVAYPPPRVNKAVDLNGRLDEVIVNADVKTVKGVPRKVYPL